MEHRRRSSPVGIVGAESMSRRRSSDRNVVDQDGFLRIVGRLKGCFGLGRREPETLRLKDRFFMENGSHLLEELICSCQARTNPIRMFSSGELEKATNNYDNGNIIGKGISFVYRGTLDNRAVAVKKFDISPSMVLKVSDAIYEMFITEIVCLSQINHKNVVKLLGCGLESRYPVLVYEFIPNGTLEGRIYEEDPSRQMSWKDRLRNAREIADALAYLHTGLPRPIVHTGLHTSRILIDEFHSAKIGTFGFSVLIPSDETQAVRKLSGYTSTGEPRDLYGYSEKDDVHDFGVVLIELLTGKQGMVLPFISSLKNNDLDLILEARLLEEGKIKQLMECAVLASRCVLHDDEGRPTMKEVAQELRKMSKRLE
ncbi:Wall-associated receptor kinase-like 2 [Acorus gramineus]|uniref:Wall-associated receptor kinase-like 2 n=1 Tax=Acorus gramineus TaxID=55184 RepID=A0AAV9ALG7_ACOGR|nr:Wall-associated receptor kinase-like 2 [Acorus gramineus]